MANPKVFFDLTIDGAPAGGVVNRDGNGSGSGWVLLDPYLDPSNILRPRPGPGPGPECFHVFGFGSRPKKPFAAIVGGSKLSSKIGVIESLLEEVDTLLLGGGMIFTFFKAQGKAVGCSLVEEDKLDLATSLMEKAKTKGVSLLLPTDVVIADKFSPDANSKIVPATAIPDGWMGLDIGPDAIKTFNEVLDTTKTVIWNGPMGVFEFDKFAAGTESIAKKLADLSGKGVTTIIGGGDSVAAVEKVGLANKMSHISTGDGASLELLEGKPLPGVLALDSGTAHRAHSSTERVTKYLKSTVKKYVLKAFCCLLSEAVVQVVGVDALDNDA